MNGPYYQQYGTGYAYSYPQPYPPYHYPPPHMPYPLPPWLPAPPHHLPPPPLTQPASPSRPPAILKPTDAVPRAAYAIWSRRPRRPSQAPPIIISSRAHPPPHVLDNALDLPTPPPSPSHDPENLLPSKTPPTSLPSSSTATDATNTPSPTTSPGSPVSTTNTSVSVNLSHSELSLKAPPSPVAPPPQKKSWASLLHQPSPSSPSTKNSLPTSNVVGISVPAATTANLDLLKKADLLKLLSHTTSHVSSTHTYANAATSAPHPTAPPPIRPRGLVNTGNMCFANSVLQVLVYCPPFHRFFADLGRALGESGGTGLLASLREPDTSPQPDTPLVDATITFLKEFGASPVENSRKATKGKEKEVNDDDWDGESFIPSYVYDALKEKKRFDHMRGGQQEDAEEFLGFYLDTLEEELLSVVNALSPSSASRHHANVEENEEQAPAEEDGWLEVGRRNRSVITRTIKSAESAITRMFGGKFRSTLRAPSQKDSVLIEDWRSLRLDIQPEYIHTVQDALSHISQPQSVQVTQPTRPGVNVDASQLVLIESLPPVLILHMKRFCYDTNVGGVVKVGKYVAFGPELDVKSDVMVMKRPPVTKYKLFGVVYHHGVSASGGHYTLDVLHPNRYPVPGGKAREGWIRVDDELVSDVLPDDVFAPSADDTRCAYLLFYRRLLK